MLCIKVHCTVAYKYKHLMLNMDIVTIAVHESTCQSFRYVSVWDKHNCLMVGRQTQWCMNNHIAVSSIVKLNTLAQGYRINLDQPILAPFGQHTTIRLVILSQFTIFTINIHIHQHRCEFDEVCLTKGGLRIHEKLEPTHTRLYCRVHCCMVYFG